MKKIIVYTKPYHLDKIIRHLIEQGIEEFYFQEIKIFNLSNVKNHFLPQIKLELYALGLDILKVQTIFSEYKTQEFLEESNETSIEFYAISNFIDISSGEIFLFSNP